MIHPIFERSEADLGMAIGKITYLGEQFKPIPTIMFSTHGYKGSVDLFRDVQGGVSYQNDRLGMSRFSVAPSEFRRILLAVRHTGDKAEAGRKPDFLSCVVIRETAGEPEGCEISVDSDVAVDFYRELIESLNRDNEEGRRILTRQFDQVVPSSERGAEK